MIAGLLPTDCCQLIIGGKIGLPQSRLPDLQIDDRNWLPGSCRLSIQRLKIATYYRLLSSCQLGTLLGLQLHRYKFMAEMNWHVIVDFSNSLGWKLLQCKVSPWRWFGPNEKENIMIHIRRPFWVQQSALLAIPLLKAHLVFDKSNYLNTQYPLIWISLWIRFGFLRDS